MYAHLHIMCRRLTATIPGLLIILLLPGCETTKPAVEPAIAAARGVRLQTILVEEPGDYFIGRRYHVEPTRYWGYLRSPRNDWSTAKLVVMNESIKPVPGSLLGREEGGEADPFQDDHNFEYKIHGHYSGRDAYDPNSNMILPEFILEDYELIDSDPGWLFDPREVPPARRLRPDS
jgi:hypothetical protein